MRDDIVKISVSEFENLKWCFYTPSMEVENGYFIIVAEYADKFVSMGISYDTGIALGANGTNLVMDISLGTMCAFSSDFKIDDTVIKIDFCFQDEDQEENDNYEKNVEFWRDFCEEWLQKARQCFQQKLEQDGE